MDKDISSIRRVYDKSHLEENKATNPFELFSEWFDLAIKSDMLDPTAFFLATSDSNAKPDGRIVLLKEFNKDGFVFFTNYQSKKGKDIDKNPYVTAVFFWSEFERQIRISGKVEKISRKESEEYFHSRPREAQVGTWASRQSSPIQSRKDLENKYSSMEEKFKNQEIPMPEYWGGYIIIPDYFEFWQGRPGRLHDRIVFQLKISNWERTRLEP